MRAEKEPRWSMSKRAIAVALDKIETKQPLINHTTNKQVKQQTWLKPNAIAAAL